MRGAKQWRCLTTQAQEESQASRSLIITCESCGKVNYFKISSESEIAEIFNAYQCPGGCEKQYHSYISVGEILLNPTQPPLTRVA